MKAANRIRAYLAERKPSSPNLNISVVTAEDGSRVLLTIKDLEKILASRDDFRDRYHNAKGAASASEHMLVDNIRIYAEALQLADHKNATAADVLTEIKHLMSVRDVLAGKLRPYTGDIPADVRTLAGQVTDVAHQRDALRKRIQEITDRFLPAWSRHTPEGQLSGITNSLQLTPSARAEKMRERVAGLLVLPADATYEQCTDRLRLRLSREQRVFGGLKKLVFLADLAEPEPNFDPEQLVERLQVHHTERMRKSPETAERQLRTALRQLVMDFLHPSFKDSTPTEQLAELRSLIQILQRQRAAGSGVQAIAEARAYQLSRYPREHDKQEGHGRQLLAAAIALTSGVSALYPFGEDSWEKIRHYGPLRNGRRNQYAHAGACIAALIDLLPAEQSATQKDHAAYPGEAGDLF